MALNLKAWSIGPALLFKIFRERSWGDSKKDLRRALRYRQVVSGRDFVIVKYQLHYQSHYFIYG